MSDERSFERFVAGNVAGAAGSIRMPDDFYDDIHAFASRTRQHPEWLALIKEPPMRQASRVVVGSPAARVATLAVTTLLMALLGVGALVAGAQSPSPVPSVEPPSFFTGTAPTSGSCQIASPTTEVVGGVTHKRGESWGCLTWTTDDVRFSGVSKVIWNADEIMLPSDAANPGLGATRAGHERIENTDGAWEGTWTELSVGSGFDQTAGWFSGEGAYDGLAAYVVISGPEGDSKVWGVIKPDDGFEAPAAFADE